MSLAILSVIAAVCYVSFSSVNRVVDLNRRNEELLRDVRSFLGRLDVEISGAVYVRRAEGTIFLSTRSEVGGEKTNNLVFTTVSPQVYMELGKRGEIIRVEYIVEQSEEDNELIVVKKRIFFNNLTPEIGYFTSEVEETANAAQYTIRDDFTVFQLRFYSQGKWYDSWDTREMDRLPDGVELIFSLGGKKYREFFNVFISEI